MADIENDCPFAIYDFGLPIVNRAVRWFVPGKSKIQNRRCASVGMPTEHQGNKLSGRHAKRNAEHWNQMKLFITNGPNGRMARMILKISNRKFVTFVLFVF